MKVSQILYSGLGGHGSVAFSLLEADKEGRWEPWLGFLGVEPLVPAYSETCRLKGIPHKYFPATAGKPWKSWPGIFRWLKECRPQFVVLHSVTALLPCFCYARWRAVPLVVVEHQPNTLKRPIEWTFSYVAMLLADQIVVLTPSYSVELEERLGWLYRKDKVRVVPNGIDTTRFSPKAGTTGGYRRVRLGMAARFTKMKRQDVLIGMLVELRKRYPAIDWRLSLAGDGENWATIREAVRKKGLESLIDLPGRLDEAPLAAWYQTLDIYIHASEGETLSTSLLQAMATALPIVASDVSGVGNLIAEGTVCGVLVPEQSPKAFAETVFRLLRDPAAMVALGEAGRALAVNSYSHNTMFANYSMLLNGMQTGRR